MVVFVPGLPSWNVPTLLENPDTKSAVLSTIGSVATGQLNLRWHLYLKQDTLESGNWEAYVTPLVLQEKSIQPTVQQWADTFNVTTGLTSENLHLPEIV